MEHPQGGGGEVGLELQSGDEFGGRLGRRWWWATGNLALALALALARGRHLQPSVGGHGGHLRNVSNLQHQLSFMSVTAAGGSHQ